MKNFDLKTIEGIRKLVTYTKKVMDEISTDPDDYISLCESALKLTSLLASLAYAKGTSLLLRRQSEYDAIVENDMEYYRRLSGTNQQKLIEGHKLSKEAVALNEVVVSLERNVRTTSDILRTVISIKKSELEKGLI